MSGRIIPTDEECRIIRQCAEKSAGATNVVIRPGERYSLTNSDAPTSINIALLDPDPDFGDTDLHDNSGSFADFRKGFEAAEGGAATVDFYVYRRTGVGRDYDEELMTNVTAYWRDGRMIAVYGTCDGCMWGERIPNCT